MAPFVTKSGLKVHVYKADITKLPVDAIVCATGENQGFKVLLSFWPLGARKRSYIRTRHSL